MPATKSKKTGKIITLILMILSLNTIYQLPYLMYYYYTPLQEAMGLVGRDADYGSLLNFYGIMNVVLYIPGGWIADKFSAKWLMVFSMVGTGVLGLWESTFPSYETLKLIMALYAVTTVLTFWSASIKCINLVADKNEQGGMFGALEAGRSVCGLLVTTLFTTIYAANAANSTVAMGSIIRTCGIIMIGVGILLAVFMPVPKDVEYTNKSLLDSFKAVFSAFKLPVTYLLAGLIFAGSLTGAAASHYAPYMTKVLGLPQTVAILFTNYRGVVCGLVGASTAALMATKFGRSSKPLLMFAGIWLACYVTMWVLPGTSAVMWPILVITVIASLCHSTFRALYYATIDEMGTPKTQVGSVIGLASILGFLPDTFYSTMVGGWLDANGDAAYKMIWMTCIAAVALGLVCAVITDRKILAYRKANGEG